VPSARRALVDRNGNLRQDAVLESARIVANANALQLSEAEKAKKLLAGLREVFECRLIGAETATNLDIKEKITSETFAQIRKLIEKGKYPKKLTDIFMEHVVPNTTLQQGD